MGIFFGSAVLLFLAVPIVVLTKRRTEECLPVAALSSILLMCIFGQLGILRVAVPALITVAVIGCGVSVYALIREKAIRDFSRCFVTPGLFLFLLFVFVLPLLCSRLKLFDWDEYSHWALVVKDMYLSDAMPYREGSHVVFNSYPPFVTLFEYFFQKCNGEYSVPVLYASQNLLGILFMLPFSKRIQRKQWYALAPLAVVMAGLPQLLFPNYWIEVGVDCVLGLGMGYTIAVYFCEERKDLFSLYASCLGISFVIMAKNVGLIAAIIPIGLLLADYIFVQRKEARVKNTPFVKRMLCLLICVILAFGPKVAYEATLLSKGIHTAETKVIIRLIDRVTNKMAEAEASMEDVPQQAETTVRLRSAAAVQYTAAATSKQTQDTQIRALSKPMPLREDDGSHLGGLLNDYQFAGFEAFLRFWDFDNIYQYGPIKVSFWFLYISLILAGVCLAAKYRSASDIKSIRVCIAGLMIGFCVYALISMVGILFAFNKWQASELSGYSRYLRVVYMAIFVIYLQMLLRLVDEKNFLTAILVVFCVVLAGISPYKIIYQITGHSSAYEDRFDEKTINASLYELDTETSKVAFISQGSTGEYLNCVRYYAMPVRVDACVGWNLVGDPEDVWEESTEATSETWANTLIQKGFTHVYVYQTDDYFRSEFAWLFEEPNDIRDNALYVIDTTASDIKLSLIAE